MEKKNQYLLLKSFKNPRKKLKKKLEQKQAYTWLDFLALLNTSPENIKIYISNKKPQTNTN